MKNIKIIIFLVVSLWFLNLEAAVLPQIFVTADRCISCHNGLITPKGEDISFGVDWRSSMMAHSSRDPYWQASVRRETMVHPSVSEAIEHECAACHMPMSRYLDKASGQKGKVFANLPIVYQNSHSAQLAADGVSCSMCHQIREDKLGTKESFTAGFVVDTKTAMGNREIFGPFEVDKGREALMQSSAQFIPQQSAHIQGSEFCASCHTLYTHAFNDKGEVIGELPEQVPYLEWKHSAFYKRQSCQSCHMPEVEGKTHITGVVGKDREDVSRHVFRGGNFFMPKIFNRYRDELGVTAQPQELNITSIRTAEHLRSSSAEISFQDVEITGDQLQVRVSITNLAGHKLPSAYPSRRAWIHMAVYDGNKNLVFESGRLNPDGSIQGNDNDADPDCFEPHYTTIESPEGVQIYEGILAGPGDKVTTVLLSAVRYIKDNRLLPEGFDKASAGEDFAVNGRADEDENFTGGEDSISYLVSLKGAKRPIQVRAELWYQPIAFRWAQNLKQKKSSEIDRFVSYYNELASISGITLASAEIEVK